MKFETLTLFSANLTKNIFGNNHLRAITNIVYIYTLATNVHT